MSPKTKDSHSAAAYHRFCKKLRPGLAAMGLSPIEIARECGRLWREKKLASKNKSPSKMSPSKMSPSKKSPSKKSTQIGGGKEGMAIRAEAFRILGLDDNESNIRLVADRIASIVDSVRVEIADIRSKMSAMEKEKSLFVTNIKLLRDLINTSDPDDELNKPHKDVLLSMARIVKGKMNAYPGHNIDFWDRAPPTGIDTRDITAERSVNFRGRDGVRLLYGGATINVNTDAKTFSVHPARMGLERAGGGAPIDKLVIGGVGYYTPVGRLPPHATSLSLLDDIIVLFKGAAGGVSGAAGGGGSVRTP